MNKEQSEIRDYLWVSPRRFGDITGIPVSTVYRYVNADKIHHRRRDGRIWLAAPTAEMAAALSPGVLPRKYRDEYGQPLEGAHSCPRSELLYGTAAANLERAYAVARINVEVLPDSPLQLRDVLAPDVDLPPGIRHKATEIEEDLKSGIRDTYLY
jgi:hypothetical protein